MSALAQPFNSAEFLATLTGKPGVYRMVGQGERVLYVGKARSLRRRVSSYFRPAEQLSPKVQALMQQVDRVEVTVTRTEGEALLLESNLIKELRPRYNVVLRDDKSYPYIHVSTEHAFPRMSLHRGARKNPGRYLGPYPSAGAVRETLSLLQKLFRIRQCEESYFRNRSRPCLQHQLGRCTAPCVGLIDKDAYREDLRYALLFLEGRSGQVVDELVEQMTGAAEKLEFERAARLRDQIAQLRRVQERQHVNADWGDMDILAAAHSKGIGCVQAFFVRGGRNLGNTAFFPRRSLEMDEAELLRAYVGQVYLGSNDAVHIPPHVLLSCPIEDQEALAKLLSERAGRKVRLQAGVRGERAQWLELARENARVSVSQRLLAASTAEARLEGLRDALGLAEVPQRIECFDISHSQGESTTGSCVVFDSTGARKSNYRRFNIRGIRPGDDYAAMEQALRRRYGRLQREAATLPDVILIDGGKGQLAQAAAVFADLGMKPPVLVGVAKGVSRKPGMESLFLFGSERPLILPSDSQALHLIQQIRDEAHRFAIVGHRQRRARARNTSMLEQVPGVGPKKRQRLMAQFGGLQGLTRAGVEELSLVGGISVTLARRIYDLLHAD